MNWTHDQLEKLGYRPSTDGSFYCAEKIPHTKPKPTPRPALDGPAKRKETSQSRITLCITRCSTKLLDADNFAGGCKPLIDQLRYAKLIPDDDPETVEILFRQIKVKTKAEEMTQVEITRSCGDYKRGGNDLVKTSFD
jgi:hypothetical protein